MLPRAVKTWARPLSLPPSGGPTTVVLPVPAFLVCAEYSPEQARAWLDAGELAELERARHVLFVDIDSGHWPMVTRAAELARILDDATKAV